jgi:hypothetical protein
MDCSFSNSDLSFSALRCKFVSRTSRKVCSNVDPMSVFNYYVVPPDLVSFACVAAYPRWLIFQTFQRPSYGAGSPTGSFLWILLCIKVAKPHQHGYMGLASL